MWTWFAGNCHLGIHPLRLSSIHQPVSTNPVTLQAKQQAGNRHSPTHQQNCCLKILSPQPLQDQPCSLEDLGPSPTYHCMCISPRTLKALQPETLEQSCTHQWAGTSPRISLTYQSVDNSPGTPGPTLPTSGSKCQLQDPMGPTVRDPRTWPQSSVDDTSPWTSLSNLWVGISPRTLWAPALPTTSTNQTMGCLILTDWRIKIIWSSQ